MDDVAGPGVAKQPAQLRDPVLSPNPRTVRRIVTPGCLDQPVDRDHPVGLEQQHGQYGLGMPAAYSDRLPVNPHLDRPEHAELDGLHMDLRPQDVESARQ